MSATSLRLADGSDRQNLGGVVILAAWTYVVDSNGNFFLSSAPTASQSGTTSQRIRATDGSDYASHVK